MSKLFTLPQQTTLTNTGALIPGARAYFYEAGTSTLLSVYTEYTLTTAHANPVIADSAGRFPAIYYDPNDDYKVKVTDASDVEIYSQDFSAVADENAFTRTAAEIAAGVTPSDYAYPQGDSRRYGALFDDSTDDTTAHQAALDVLAQAGGGTWNIEGGVSRAQGLILKASFVEITGSGWLKPVSNAASAFVLQIGDDASSSTVQQVKGHLRIGDRANTFSSWTNIVGLKLERLFEPDLRIDTPGLGVGTDVAAKGSGVAYGNYYLGDMTNCKVALRFNVQTGGYANENVWIGGRFAINSGIWESGVCDIQVLDNSGASVNGNVFIKPSFEGDGRCVDFDNATNNSVILARWEGPSSGTEDVDFDSVFFKIDSDCAYNNIELAQGFDWTLSDTKEHGAADTRNSNGSFTINGSDLTAWFYKGAPIKVTVSGTAYTSFVTRSLFTGGNTRVYIGHPWITTAPTQVETARVQDEGFTEFRGPSTNTLDGVVSLQGGLHTSQRVSGAQMLTHQTVSALTGNHPVFLHSEAETNTNRFLEVRDAAAALEYWIDGRGHNYVTALSVGDVTTPIASRTHVVDPSGGATVDAEARTAINAILASLEAFGLHSSS